MSDRPADAEIQAIQQIIAALEPLDKEALTRVVEYVFGRLGIGSRPHTQEFRALGVSPTSPETHGSIPQGYQTALADIRTLREQKSPRNAMEMAALVAYYLSELAHPSERKPEVTAADLTRLFKQAGFPLPETPKMTLVHAKNAGYLDPGSERGAYVLNPVGYNLVAHKLPASDVGALGRPTASRKGRRRPEKKGSARSKQRARKSTQCQFPLRISGPPFGPA